MTTNKFSINYGMKRLAKRLQKLEKGDRIIDKAFQPYANGVTKYSLRVWDEIKKHVDITGFTVAKMEYSVKDHYTFTLTHKDGYKFVFNGVSAGYHGEGSRGTEKILKEIGFAKPERVFDLNNETFTFKRKTA